VYVHQETDIFLIYCRLWCTRGNIDSYFWNFIAHFDLCRPYKQLHYTLH